MLRAKLLWRAVTVFFETLDHMAAIRKTGFLADVGEIEICK